MTLGTKEKQKLASSASYLVALDVLLLWKACCPYRH